MQHAAYTEAVLLSDPDPGLGVRVIWRDQKNDVVRNRHRVIQEIFDFAPGRIRHDPVDLFIEFEEITAFIQLAPQLIAVGRKQVVESTLTSARIEHAAERGRRRQIMEAHATGV